MYTFQEAWSMLPPFWKMMPMYSSPSGLPVPVATRGGLVEVAVEWVDIVDIVPTHFALFPVVSARCADMQ
jgi:hypothetical protein